MIIIVHVEREIELPFFLFRSIILRILNLTKNVSRSCSKYKIKLINMQYIRDNGY